MNQLIVHVIVACSFEKLDFYPYLRGPEAEQKLRSGHKDQTDGNWSSFQLANSTPPQSVIDRAIAPSARIHTGMSASVPRPHSSVKLHFRAGFKDTPSAERQHDTNVKVINAAQANGK